MTVKRAWLDQETGEIYIVEITEDLPRYKARALCAWEFLNKVKDYEHISEFKEIEPE